MPCRKAPVCLFVCLLTFQISLSVNWLRTQEGSKVVPIQLFLVVNNLWVFCNTMNVSEREGKISAGLIISSSGFILLDRDKTLSSELDCLWWLSSQLLSLLDLLVYTQLCRAFCWRSHVGLVPWPYGFPVSTLSIVFVFIPLPISQTKRNIPCDFSHSETNDNSSVGLFFRSVFLSSGLRSYFWLYGTYYKERFCPFTLLLSFVHTVWLLHFFTLFPKMYSVGSKNNCKHDEF